MINQVFTSKGMMNSELLKRSVVWEFMPSQITFKEQYHEIATGELVKSGADIFIIPKEQVSITQGALNG
jgi:hypothetical protein